MNPILFEVMRNAVEGIPEQMGVSLQKSAFSANIKERKDESCALFGKRGEMIAQAEHIPVHLGAMPSALESVIKKIDMEDGDQIILNDPYSGGTHLPDITVVCPVFRENELIGYVVNRAHHADVGGSTPGSMPGDSTNLDQEGLVIPPTKIMSEGEILKNAMDILKETRDPIQRIGDLNAQIGTNIRGARELNKILDKFGLDTYEEYVSRSLDYSEKRTKEVLDDIPSGVFSSSKNMIWDEQKIPIYVRITVNNSRIMFDFEGTSSQVKGNINAPIPVTLSAIYYVIRCMIPEDIPMNEGVYRPIKVSVPKGSLLNPDPPAAVSAGNVETSQMVVELILDAFREALPDRIPAESQSTMNNVTIGNSRFTYYETIGGGAGAYSSGDGESGVHVHMTNTKNTPVEVLENEYPLRVHRYLLRKRSGGDGLYQGGDGIVREIEVLESSFLSIQSQMRVSGPEGMKGGESGKRGKNMIFIDGKEKELSSNVSLRVKTGQRINIKTPGGGGWGSKD